MPFILTRSEISTLEADACLLDGTGALTVKRRGLLRRDLDILCPTPGTDAEALTAAYLAGLEAASGRGCGAVAMALLGLASSADPETSVRAGVRAASIFLRGHDMSITLSVPESAVARFDDGFYAALRDYIHARYSGPDGTTGIFNRSLYRLGAAPMSTRAVPPVEAEACAAPTVSLEDMLKAADAGFSETLLRLIDQGGHTDAEIYKKANIDRKLFSKIRSKPDYRPSKSTALALGVALDLPLDGLRDLLSRAGYSLTRASRRDIIVEYFVSRGQYDIFAINEALFAFDEPLLGGA